MVINDQYIKRVLTVIAIALCVIAINLCFSSSEVSLDEPINVRIVDSEVTLRTDVSFPDRTIPVRIKKVDQWAFQYVTLQVENR